MLAGKAQRGALLHLQASSHLAYTLVEHGKQNTPALFFIASSINMQLLLLAMAGALSCDTSVEAACIRLVPTIFAVRISHASVAACSE